jgi:NitT/TauT family transport system substrate-binding protein
MLVTRKMIEADPEAVQRLVQAHARATRYLAAHPKEWLNRAAAFGTSLETLEAARGNMALTWEMDEAFVEKVKALGQRMEALGIITRQPDYGRLIDLTFVNRLQTVEQP